MTLLFGVGAGLVSALLFAVGQAGGALAQLLFLLAPLPIAVAALGWRHAAGLVGAGAGALTLALAFTPLTGLAFAMSFALPAWWLAYLALLSRAGPAGAEWYPLGRLLLWIALIGSASGLTALLLAFDGDFDAFAQAVTRAFEAFLRSGPFARAGAPPPELPAELLGLLPFVIAAALAGTYLTILVLNLWLAARVVRASDRLPRPWAPLSGVRMPGAAAGLLAAALVASLVTGGFVRAGAFALLGALGVAFLLQGLALVHHVTRGRAARVAVLAALYAALLAPIVSLVTAPLIVPFLMLAGLADSLWGGLRHRLAAPPTPRPTV